jgi:hypothetical protein
MDKPKRARMGRRGSDPTAYNILQQARLNIDCGDDALDELIVAAKMTAPPLKGGTPRSGRSGTTTPKGSGASTPKRRPNLERRGSTGNALATLPPELFGGNSSTTTGGKKSGASTPKRRPKLDRRGSTGNALAASLPPELFGGDSSSATGGKKSGASTPKRRPNLERRGSTGNALAMTLPPGLLRRGSATAPATPDKSTSSPLKRRPTVGRRNSLGRIDKEGRLHMDALAATGVVVAAKKPRKSLKASKAEITRTKKMIRRHSDVMPRDLEAGQLGRPPGSSPPMPPRSLTMSAESQQEWVLTARREAAVKDLSVKARGARKARIRESIKERNELMQPKALTCNIL